VAPIEPDSPKIPRNVLLSIFLGIMLGCGIALLAELLDRRIRSDQDLSDVLQIPVFGVVDWKQKQRRPRGLRGLLPRRLRLN
jgi:capsular polysaccharide biosynthesis protein